MSPPPVPAEELPRAVALKIGEIQHGFIHDSPSTVSTLRLVWEAERVVTDEHHRTQIVLSGGDSVWIDPVARISFANGAIEFSGQSQAAEVVRLYATVLGREPDSEGLVFWHEHGQHGLGLAEMAQGFFDSPEFISRFGGLSNETLVLNLYREALGRLPDAQGMQYHVDALHHGLSRAQLFANFVASPEAATRFETLHPHGVWVRDAEATQIAMAYDAVFDRAPDAEGLSFWTSKLASGELDVRSLVSSIANSAEFQARHAWETDLEYVASIYRSTLEREPDQGGLQFWVDALAQHRIDRVDVVLLIGMSQEQQTQFLHHPSGDAFL